jgi:hypothetical protein
LEGRKWWCNSTHLYYIERSFNGRMGDSDSPHECSNHSFSAITEVAMLLKSGSLRGDKILYKDGIGCSIWYPFEGDEYSGICFDFSYDDIDDLINLLNQMKKIEAEPFEE